MISSFSCKGNELTGSIEHFCLCNFKTVSIFSSESKIDELPSTSIVHKVFLKKLFSVPRKLEISENYTGKGKEERFVLKESMKNNTGCFLPVVQLIQIGIEWETVNNCCAIRRKRSNHIEFICRCYCRSTANSHGFFVLYRQRIQYSEQTRIHRHGGTSFD